MEAKRQTGENTLLLLPLHCHSTVLNIASSRSPADLTGKLLKVTHPQLGGPAGSREVPSSVLDPCVGITWATERQGKTNKVETQQELQDITWDRTSSGGGMTPWVG